MKIHRQENVEVTVCVEEKILRVEMSIDPEAVDVQPSGSGKSVVFATTGGAIHVPGTNLQLNLTLYQKH